MSQQQRSIKNLVINPSFQFRIGFYFFALSLALIGLMMAIMNSYFIELRIIVSNVPEIPMTVIKDVENLLTQLFYTAIGFLALSLMGTIAYSVIITHRIAGPMYAILAYIKDLKEGNFQSTRKLRPYDELLPIMDSLVDLSDHLKKNK